MNTFSGIDSLRVTLCVVLIFKDFLAASCICTGFVVHLQQIHITERENACVMNLIPYMNPAPYTVFDVSTLYLRCVSSSPLKPSKTSIPQPTCHLSQSTN